MFSKLMPQEGKFFDLFNAHAELVVQGANQLAILVAIVPGADAAAATPVGPRPDVSSLSAACFRISIVFAWTSPESLSSEQNRGM